MKRANDGENQVIKPKTVYETKTSERVSYGIYFFGQLMLFMLVTNFFQLYLTDMGISAAIVGGVFIFAKIWDAVNDPIFGVIVDKARFKSGNKYKPWIKISGFLIPLTTIFMFGINSGLSIQIKTIWAAAGYVLWDTAYTICDVPIFAVATAMTSKGGERSKLYALNRFFCMLGGLAVVVLVPMLYPNIGWFATSIIVCVIALPTMLPIGFLAKERTTVIEEEKPTLKQLGRYLIRNKYLLIFNGAVVLAAISNTVSTVQNYFAINNLGGSEWITYIALAMSLPMLAVALFVPKIIKRVDKFRVYLIALGCSITLSIVMFFIGYSNIVIFFVMVVLRAAANSLSGVVLVMITADCAEYGHFKSGNKAQGIAFSIQTFTAKTCAALSSAIGMFILGAFGFRSGEGIQQTQQTINAIWFLFSVAPSIMGAIAFVLLLVFYKLNDRDVNIMTLCNNGEITREQAEAQLSRKY